MDSQGSTEQQTRRDEVITAAMRWFDGGRFLAELAPLVAVVSESQTGGHEAEMRSYLADHIGQRLEALGFTFSLHDNPEPGAPPLLTAERIEDPALPVVLIYGHGDVCAGQPERWREGLSPFALTVEGERVYGRGTADNKGQHLVNISALAQVMSARGRLGFNAKILIEMAEETGSPGLRAFCRDAAPRLAADVLIASDGPRLEAGRPTVFLGSRAALNFELCVDQKRGALHSGNFGGLVTDPAIRLVQAIATLTGPEGALKVPEWRCEAGLAPALRAAVAALPVGGGRAVDESWGEPGLSPAERAFCWNSFAVLSFLSGTPAAPQNAIAGEARATCQLRYIAGTDPAQLLPGLRRHLDAAGFGDVQIHAREIPHPATRTDPANPWVQRVLRSVRATTGTEAHLLPNLAGSIPNDAFTGALDLPTIWIPHSYGGCNQHGPDEHLLLPVMREGLAIMTGLFWDLGEAA